MIPKDPVMLLSFINLKLRDFYDDLDALCDDLDIDRQEIEINWLLLTIAMIVRKTNLFNHRRSI